MEGGEEVKCYCLEGGSFSFLTACVFVTRDTVRHPRRFVFGKFVRKPNCSRSDAFVNRGLTVQQNFIMFIIVLGQHVSILIESSSGPSKIQILT